MSIYDEGGGREKKISLLEATGSIQEEDHSLIQSEFDVSKGQGELISGKLKKFSTLEAKIRAMRNFLAANQRLKRSEREFSDQQLERIIEEFESFSDEQTANDEHIVISGNKTYSINDLIEAAKSLPVITMDCMDLEHAMNLVCWDDDDGKKIKPADVLRAMFQIEDLQTIPREHRLIEGHIKRILNAETIHPLLVANIENNTIVLDGMHRLAKIFFEKKEKVLVKKFNKLPENLGLSI